jgi:hypothetical protein
VNSTGAGSVGPIAILEQGQKRERNKQAWQK